MTRSFRRSQNLRTQTVQILRFAILLCLISVGCRDALQRGAQEKHPSEEIGFGSVEDSVYHNEFFGLSIDVPEEWNIQNQETLKQLTKQSSEIVAGDDKNLKAVIDAAELQTVQLLAAFKYPVGKPVPFNPNILCIAERVSTLPGIERGNDYHFHTKRLLESSDVIVSFPEENSTVQLGGMDFDVMTIHINVAGTTVRQKQFAAIIKGYALVINVSYSTDDEESEVEAVLDTVRFE